jgi:anaerobic magnesium-protoporphyrin IX monomethyl ester cyclase
MIKKMPTVVLFFPKFNIPTAYTPGFITLPQSLLFLAAPLISEGYHVILIDERLNGNKYQMIETYKDSIIACGISCIIPQVSSGLKFAKYIKENLPDVPVVWGGWHPTLHHKQTIGSLYVDVVVRGDGEETLVELVKRFYNGQPLDDVLGITYKDDGGIRVNPDRPLLKKFPSFFLPYHLLDLKKYEISRGIVDYVSSKGCPHRCQFCAIQSVYHRRWIGQRALDVVRNLEILNKEYKVHHIRFIDNNFCVNIKRVRSICQEIIAKKLKVTWEGNGHLHEVRRLDEDLLSLAKKAGLIFLDMGIESGSKDMLELIKKDLTLENLLPVIKRLDVAQIRLCTNFIVGFPTETTADRRKTFMLIRKILDLNPQHQLKLFLYHPIPGTPLYDLEVEQGIIIDYVKGLEDWGGYKIMANRPWLPEAYPIKNYRDLEPVRIQIFYFKLGYLRNNTQKGFFRFIFKILQAISSFRVNNEIYSFPIEWLLFKFYYRLRRSRFKLSVR